MSSFACLLYICLSSGARVICHLLRALRLSDSFCLICKGLLSDRGWDRGGGVANLAACWISAVRIATAVSMSDLDFSGICVSIRSTRVFRKASQSVYLLCRDGFCCCRMTRVCKVIKIGVWSEESYKHEAISVFCVLMPFVMQKSNKSGCLFVSLGQKVG